MIVKINSENDNLMSILNKNPKTDMGLYLKPLRNGQLIGNVEDRNNYTIVFQDTKHSFTRYEDNQTDFKSFCDPEVSMCIVRDMLGHLLVDRQSYENDSIPWLNATNKIVDNQSCTIVVENFYIQNSWQKDGEFLLSKYFPQIQLEEREGVYLYRLTITAKTVFDAVNLLALTSFFMAVVNESIWVQDGQVEKYVTVLTNLKTPYFVYYLFNKRVLWNKRETSKYPEYMQKITASYLKWHGEKITFTPNDTQGDRLRFAQKHLNEEIPILDVACNKFSLYKFLLKRFPKMDYYGYDVDEEIQMVYDKWRVGRYSGHDNFNFSLTLPDISGEVQIVIVEGVEHFEYPEQEIKNLFNTYDVGRMIITTPNIDFNVHYGIDGFRRDDHLREYTKTEFRVFMINLIPEGYEVEFFRIGDCIGNNCTTLGAVINKTKL